MKKNNQKIKEPAQISYFFGQSYVELWNTIKSLWEKNVDRITSAGKEIKGAWRKSNKYVAICMILFKICILISLAIFGTIFTIIFSVCHTIILLILTILVYIGFVIARLLDSAFCLVKGISTNCYNPQCERKFVLPIYVCPKCKQLHHHLVPSKYGILKRRCLCGEKLPTTFINGRQKLDSLCPHCQSDAIKGVHSSILLPIIGSTSSGKTCFVNMAISGIENNASNYNLEFNYLNVHGDEYLNNMNVMKDGNLPLKTNDLRFKYYNFYLSQKNQKIKNLISICDIAGEVFSNQTAIIEQQGFRYADGLICVIDPLSVEDYRKEVSKSIDISPYMGASQSMSEILSGIINTLEGLFRRSSKQILKMNVCVVITKSDIPGLDEKIGEIAVNNYLQKNPKATLVEANSAVCENFLKDYNEINFLNEIKGKFKEVQFYSCSALGHLPSGEKFVSRNITEPLLWTINKLCPNTNLKQILEKRN